MQRSVERPTNISSLLFFVSLSAFFRNINQLRHWELSSSGEVNTVRLVNANGYYYWFVFFWQCLLFSQTWAQPYRETGGMLQKFGNRGLNHQTTHCVAQLALHLAQPRLWCHSPLPSKGPWQGNNYNYNKKETKQVRRFFCKRHWKKVYLLLLLSVSLSICLSARFAFSHSFNYCLLLFCLLLFLLLLPLICAKFWQLKEQAKKQVG